MPPKKPESSSGDLFRALLENNINPKHELVLLAKLIDWERFDEEFGAFYDDRAGREALPTRLMAGVHLLKHMKGISDEKLCEQWVENPYYQFFCGEIYFQHDLSFDRSSMTNWRQRIGAETLEVLVAETIRIALHTKAVKPLELQRITVDTTVQTKAIAHPTDSHLIVRAIEWLNRAARKWGLNLRQSFIRVAPAFHKQASRLFHGGKNKQARRWVSKMRTILGRLIRDIERKIAGNEGAEAFFATQLERARTIQTQERSDKNKLYALHAPEVECIGKGKARVRYEFGVKTSIATTNARTKGGQFIVGMQTCPGNPHDSRTLADQMEQVERITQTAVQRAYVDRGYRGHKVERKGLDVIISHTRGVTSPTIKREMKRRNGIEPVIGHTKHDGLLERNHLKGQEGDAINAILCAAGHNMRLLVRWLRLILSFLLFWLPDWLSKGTNRRSNRTFSFA